MRPSRCSKPPPKGAWIGKSYQSLDYDEGHWYCGSSKVFGHAHNSCQKHETTMEEPIKGSNKGQWVAIDGKQKRKEEEDERRVGAKKLQRSASQGRWIPKVNLPKKDCLGQIIKKQQQVSNSKIDVSQKQT